MASYKLCFPKSDGGSAPVVAVKIACEFAGVEIKDDNNCKCTSVTGRSPKMCMTKHSVSSAKAILRTVARMRPDKCLYGASFEDSSMVDQWLDYMNEELNLPAERELASKATAADTKKIKDALAVINKHLLTSTYMVEHTLTIADIYLVVGLNQFTQDRQQELLKGLGNLNRLIETCVNQKQTKKHLVVKAAAPKPVAAANAGDDEAPPPKKVNPLDSLPPSTMNLDEWKRCYSNTKDPYNVAMPWFWKNFDKNGWSLWYMKYDKMEDECKVAYLTSNLLGGFLQRVDGNFRKYSFAVNNIVEEKGSTDSKKAFDILGVWMWRGQEMPAELKDHPSIEYHTFTKLDSENASHRKLVEDYWCADEMVEERVIADCKVWK